jgi:TetR/AcrR family transcriptional regulator
LSIADRRAQDRARRKEQILQAARATFAETGWHRATVDSVAERAQVGKGTIYLYFDSKEAILAELVLEALAELGTRLRVASESRSPLHPAQRLRAMADAYLAYAQNAPDYFRLLTAFDGGSFQNGVSAEQQEELLARSNHTLELVTQVIGDGMALGVFVPGHPRQTAGVLWAALNGALGLLAHPVRRSIVPATAEEFYFTTLELFLRGISVEDGHPGF